MLIQTKIILSLAWNLLVFHYSTQSSLSVHSNNAETERIELSELLQKKKYFAVQNGPQVYKKDKLNICKLSYKLTLHDLWPFFVTFDIINMCRIIHYINKPS